VDRALVLPLVALAVLVLAWIGLEANRYLVLLAEGEVRALVQGASALADPRPLARLGLRVTGHPDWTYAASTCTGNRGLKSRLGLPAMSLRRHW
jgi:hypothetical protein